VDLIPGVSHGECKGAAAKGEVVVGSAIVVAGNVAELLVF
jgi:hypothetical protein